MDSVYFRGRRARMYMNDSVAYWLKITNESEFTGESFVCQCVFNNRQVIGQWSLASGGQYVQMNDNGKVTVKAGVEYRVQGVDAYDTVTF